MSSQGEGRPISERLVVSTLLKFSTQQRQRFVLYLDSPYFKVHKDIPGFFRVLDDHLVEHGEQITDEVLYGLLYPEKAHDSPRLNRLFFKLLEALTNFLAQEHFQRQKELSKVFSLNEMLEWRFDELFWKKHKKTLKELEEAKFNSESALADIIQFRLGFANYLLRNTSKGEIMETLTQILREQMGLDYLVQLKLYTAMVNRSLISGLALTIPKPVPGHGTDTTFPLVGLYECVLEMQEAMMAKDLDQAMACYLKLKDSLVKQIDRLDEKEAIDLYHHGLNFLSAWDVSYFSDLDHLAEKYFWTARITRQMLSLGRLDWMDFYNHSISLVSHLKDLEAARELLDEVGDKLAGDEREAAAAFVNGLIQYAEGKFKEAGLCFFNVVVLTRVQLINIHCRGMYLRCLYESGDFASIDSHNEALRQYLIRASKSGEIAQEKIAQFHTFNKHLKASVKEMMRPQKKLKKLRELKEKVKNSETAFKGWLLEKLEEAGAP